MFLDRLKVDVPTRDVLLVLCGFLTSPRQRPQRPPHVPGPRACRSLGGTEDAGQGEPAADADSSGTEEAADDRKPCTCLARYLAPLLTGLLACGPNGPAPHAARPQAPVAGCTPTVTASIGLSSDFSSLPR